MTRRHEGWLERTFALTAHGTTVRTELLAGATTVAVIGRCD